MQNAKMRLGFITIIAACLFLSGCGAMTAQQMATTKKEQALSFIKLDTYLDGKTTRAFGKHCYLMVEDATGKSVGPIMPEDKDEYIFIRSEPGKLSITGMRCNEYKVLYNKPRNYKFTQPLNFTVYSGRVSYAGDLAFYFSPKSFVFLSDVISPYIVTSDTDAERMLVKFKDTYPAAQQAFLAKYGALPSGFEFEKSLVEDHPQLSK